MGTKKRALIPIKEILFTYLAISKVMYWYDTVIVMSQNDLISVGEAVLHRLLNRDLLIIVCVILFFFLERFIQHKKTKNIKIFGNIVLYAINYVVLVVVLLIYFLLLNLFLEASQIAWGFLISYTLVGYIVVAVVLNVKDYLKKKADQNENLNM